MITDPMAQLCNIAAEANTMRKRLTNLLEQFKLVSPKCEWRLPEEHCCNKYNKRRTCHFGTCPITEPKKEIQS